MLANTRTISVQPESEIGRLLDQVGTDPLIVESAGSRYRLEREPDADALAGYDPIRAREALRRSAGGLAGTNTELLKTELREQRGQDSQGRPDW